MSEYTSPGPPGTAGGLGLLEKFETSSSTDTPWTTVLYNDPVNTFAFVIKTCLRVLKCTKPEAELYTNRVHYEGKAIVYTGGKDQAELYAAQFSSAHLWCRAERTS